MKRVIRINVEGATNTCGISAVPAVDDAIESDYEEVAEEYYSEDEDSTVD